MSIRLGVSALHMGMIRTYTIYGGCALYVLCRSWTYGSIDHVYMEYLLSESETVFEVFATLSVGYCCG